MTDNQFKDFTSHWAIVYGLPMSRDAVQAWRRYLTRPTVDFELSCAALVLHVGERESSRDQMRLAIFDGCYRRCQRRLSAKVYSQGCATCEGTGYLHHVYGGDGPAETLDALFALEFRLLDVPTEAPRGHQHYRLCGIPCTCKLGEEMLAAWRRHPDGYPVDDAEVAQLRACGMTHTDAVGWLAFFQGHRDRSPVIRRSSRPQQVGAVKVPQDDWVGAIGQDCRPAPWYKEA